MYRRIGHNICYGVTISCFYGGIGLLAAANTFHKITHMIIGQPIATGIGRRHYFFVVILQFHFRKEVWFHIHSGCVFLPQPAPGGNSIGVKIQFSTIRIINFSRVFFAIMHTRRKRNLEAGGKIVRWPIFKNRCGGIPILSSIFPHINSPIGHHAARMFQPGKPMHRIYLVTHPLSGHAG